MNACKSDKLSALWLRLSHHPMRSVNVEQRERLLEQREGSAHGMGEGKTTAPPWRGGALTLLSEARYGKRIEAKDEQKRKRRKTTRSKRGRSKQERQEEDDEKERRRRSIMKNGFVYVKKSMRKWKSKWSLRSLV